MYGQKEEVRHAQAGYMEPAPPAPSTQPQPQARPPRTLSPLRASMIEPTTDELPTLSPPPPPPPPAQ
jgi:hypothetical protein